MAIRIYKRTTPGRRNASVNLHVEVTKKTPEKTLLSTINKKGGRNHSGILTSTRKGGGVKRRYRLIDWTRRKDDVVATVVGVEYDPNRSAHITLLQFADGEKRYVLAQKGIKEGQEILNSANKVEPNVGNCMPMKHIPLGLNVSCIELEPGRGAQLCRSAGTYARLTNREGGYVTLVLPSGEVRQVSENSRAVIGEIGNPDHNKVKLGKAGRARKLGRRPHTRGMAKNHHEHPMGGGDNKSSGNRPPAQRSGTLAKGGQTRKTGKPSAKRIVRRRVSKRYGQLKVK